MPLTCQQVGPVVSSDVCGPIVLQQGPWVVLEPPGGPAIHPDTQHAVTTVASPVHTQQQAAQMGGRRLC